MSDKEGKRLPRELQEFFHMPTGAKRIHQGMNFDGI
jgi:hypothetical protein